MQKKIIKVLFVATFLMCADIKSQQFDVTLTQNLGGYTSDDPAIFREFVHCKSVNTGNTVCMGTVDGLSTPLHFFMMEVDSLGVKVAANCRSIESFPNTKSIVLMDLKPLKRKNGYVGCGYQFLKSNPGILKPLTMLLDATGYPTTAYTYDDSGIFTRVCQNTNGDFIFVGSKGNSTFVKNGNRVAYVVKTDSTLIQQFYMTFPSVTSVESFDVISDIVVKSKDSAIVAGSITTNCISGGGVKVQSILICLNPNNGAIHWHQNGFNSNYVSPKIALMRDTVYVVFNAGPPNRPVITYFSAINGGFLDGKFILVNTILNCENQYINSDTVLFQNIALIGLNKIFISGKVIHQSGQFPIDFEFEKSNWNIHNSNVYFSKYKSANYDGMSYSVYHINSGCIGGSYILPIFSVNSCVLNSHQRLSTIESNTFAANKIGPYYSYFPWLFSNNYSAVTGKSSININFIPIPPLLSTTISVMTPSVRQRASFALTVNSISVQQAGCKGFYTPCNCYH